MATTERSGPRGAVPEAPPRGPGERPPAASAPGAPQRTEPLRTREEERPRRRRARRRIVQRKATVRKVDPWSVLKLSVLFYFCVLLVVMLGLTLFWATVNRLGVVETLLSFLRDLQLEVQVDGGALARAVFLLGLLNVVLWTGINVFLAFLYNLVADLVGGLRVTLAEEE